VLFYLEDGILMVVFYFLCIIIHVEWVFADILLL